MPWTRQIWFSASIASIFFVAAIVVNACPYCPPTDATLSEKLADADGACLVKFLNAKNGEELSMQTTTLEVVKSLPMRQMFKQGEIITIPIGVTAEAGDQFLLMGQEKLGEMEWSLPIPVDELGTELIYISKAPSRERAPAERLLYYWKHLDSTTPLISNDSFAEFAQAKFDDVKLLAPNFDREKIREWLEDANPQYDVRRDFYGMLLGLCGNDDDAAFLEEKILAPIPERKNRLGTGGMMAGYLMLRGQPGLKILMENKVDAVPLELVNDDPRTVDLNAVRMTLSFIWEYRREQFSEESLRAAMRRFLDRIEFAELAVVDLARWKDWTILDRLIEGYGREPWETQSAKERIISFAISCRKDVSKTPGVELPESAVKAQKFLDSLNPDFVKSVKLNSGEILPLPSSVKKSNRPEDDSTPLEPLAAMATLATIMVLLAAFHQVKTSPRRTAIPSHLQQEYTPECST